MLFVVPFAPAVTLSGQVMAPMPPVPGVPAMAGVPGYQLMHGMNPTVLQGFSLQPPISSPQPLPSAPPAAPSMPAAAIPFSSSRLPDGQLPTNTVNQLQLQQLMMNQLHGLPSAPSLHPKIPQYALSPQLHAQQMLLNQAALNSAAASPTASLQVLPGRQFPGRQTPASEYQPTVGFPAANAASPDLPATSPHNSTSSVVLVSNLNSQVCNS